MQNPLLYFLELIGLRKVIRFVQLDTIELSEQITEKEIKDIFLKASGDIQFHIGILNDCPDEEGSLYQQALIQKVVGNNDYLFICNTVPFGMTEWEKKHINEIVKSLKENLTDSKCRRLETWRLLKRAVEGKTFGEY